MFAAHALLLALLIGWWPSARAVYPAVFRAQAAAVFARGDPPALAVRPAVGERLEEKDTFVEALDPKRDGPRWRLSISALRLGYWPMAVLAALLLATPMPAWRRAFALVAGIAWLAAFALFRLGLEIERAFAELAAGEVERATGALLAYRTASEVLNSNIVVIAAVLLAWASLARPRQTLAMGRLSRLLTRRPA